MSATNHVRAAPRHPVALVIGLLVATVALTTVACGSDDAHGASSSEEAEEAPPAPAPAPAPAKAPERAAAAAPLPILGPVCGSGAAPPVLYDHVVWIWMENKSYGEVIGNPVAPYETTL